MNRSWGFAASIWAMPLTSRRTVAVLLETGDVQRAGGLRQRATGDPRDGSDPESHDDQQHDDDREYRVATTHRSRAGVRCEALLLTARWHDGVREHDVRRDRRRDVYEHERRFAGPIGPSRIASPIVGARVRVVVESGRRRDLPGTGLEIVDRDSCGLPRRRPAAASIVA
jgi:hypothetical protein